MQHTTHFKNPGPSTKSARPTSAVDDPPQSAMADPTKKIAGLAKTGGAVVGGQVAATVITNQALKFGGSMTAPGTIGHNTGAIGLPMVLGMLVMGLSKKEAVKHAGIGAVTAGVSACFKKSIL